MGEFKDVVIVSGCRTAVGSYGGSLKGVSAIDLGAIVVKKLLIVQESNLQMLMKLLSDRLEKLQKTDS